MKQLTNWAWLALKSDALEKTYWPFMIFAVMYIGWEMTRGIL